MKRKAFYIILLNIVSLFICYSGNNDTYILAGTEYYDGEELTYTITTDEFIIQEYMNYEEVKKAYKYELIYDHGIPFLKLLDNKEKWLVLFNEDFLFIYNGESESPLMQGGSKHHHQTAFLDTHPDYYKTTSFLTEVLKQYNSGNLGDFKIDNPWVEGVQGCGIGEKIFIDASEFPEVLEPKRIIISNGYVSFNKPQLYEENARLKKIKIMENKSNYEAIIELKDTPNIQVIEFPIRIEAVEIEILEVYAGTKYQDTCVNFIAIILMDF